MGSLSTALLNSTNAMQVYERVFNVIENNITNANTPGYVTQNQTLQAEPFNPTEGSTGGVLAGSLQSARSVYLEQQVRTDAEQLASSQQKASDLSQIAPLFDTTGAAGVPGAISGLFNSFSQLSVNPNDGTSRQAVITAAQQLAQAFNENAIGINTVSSNVEDQTQGAISTVNQIAAQLAQINQQYQGNAQASQDAGLEAQLYSSLQNLSQVAHYTLVKVSDGTFDVYIGGQTPLVIGNQAFAISGDFSSPNTVIRDSQGNDITAELQDTASQSGGSLGALLQEKNATIPGYLSSLNSVAQGIADAVNNQLAQGVDQTGNPPATNLFTYNAAQGAAFTLNVTNITPSQIAAALPSGPGGNGNALALGQMVNQPVVNGFTPAEAYGNVGGQVGNDVASAQQNVTSQQDLLDQAELQRSSTTGVSLNAEAAKLLQFQQAYQAVGKLVSVIDSLTETAINMITLP